LFSCIEEANDPTSSKEFEALQYLLTVFDDILARDKTGLNIFDIVDHVDVDDHLDINDHLDVNDHPDVVDFHTFYSPIRLGSYRQDLLYSALYRAGLSRRPGIPPLITKPVFNSGYTIRDYRALLYLDTWHFPRSGRTIASSRMPSREAAPGLKQWDPSDLRMMEDRIRAIDLIDDDADEDDDNDEDHYGEHEYGGEVSHEYSDSYDGNELSAMDDSTHDLYGAPAGRIAVHASPSVT
jgi:hypothetical protein